jgi:hypothetical protein
MKTIFAAALALVIWFALGLQLLLSVRWSLAHHGDVLHGVWMYFAFFTVLTNLLAALTLSMPLLAPRSAPGRCFARPGVISGVAVYLAVVGIVYHALLRQLWHPQGWQALADALLHDAAPALFLVHWWLHVPRGALHWRVLGYWCLYPIGYFGYVLLRGAFTRFYPYPFLDVAHLGYAQVFVNAAAMLAGFVALGALFVALKRVTPVRVAA